MDIQKNHRFNGDLLLSHEDMTVARQMYSGIFDVLNFPALKDMFVKFDKKANSSKRSLRKAGMASIAMGAAALIAASTAPVLHGGEGLVPKIFAGGAAVLGIASVLFGLFGVVLNSHKQDWLRSRLMTERIRQFHFQFMLRHIGGVIGAQDVNVGMQEYMELRKHSFQEFQDDHVGHLGAIYAAFINSQDVDRIQCEEQRDRQSKLSLAEGHAAKVFLDAYRRLRFNQQIDYADHMLSPQSRGALAGTLSELKALFDGVSLVSIALLFLMHIALAISLVLGFSNGDALSWFHVFAIWVAIVALSVRALEEGFQPTREIERYRNYRLAVKRIRDSFDAAPDVVSKFQAMCEMEELAFEELREFLQINHEARFVM